jgi:hypothetical protein
MEEYTTHQKTFMVFWDAQSTTIPMFNTIPSDHRQHAIEQHLRQIGEWIFVKDYCHVIWD